MHPKSNDINHYLKADILAYQGSNLAAGAATAGSAVALNQRASFVLVGVWAGTSGTPDSGSVTFAVEASANGSTGWASVNNRDGNAVTLAVTVANAIGSLNVDTQYFPAGSTHVRVVPTVAFTGGTTPKAYFTASIAYERAEHL